MLEKSVIPFTVAAFLTLGVVALAQQVSTSQESNSPTAHPANTTVVHFEGCVFPKRALTADTPVLVPSTGVEDYLLTNIKVISGSVDAEEVAKATYKLEQVTQDRLRELNSKRVGVTGRIGLVSVQPELQVVSIREISGTCPRLPGRA